MEGVRLREAAIADADSLAALWVLCRIRERGLARCAGGAGAPPAGQGCRKVNLLVEPSNRRVVDYRRQRGYGVDELIFMEEFL